jgi:hypothetical protein
MSMVAATVRNNERQRRRVLEPPPVEAVQADVPSIVPEFDLSKIEPGKLDIRAVQFYVAQKYGVTRSDMLSDRRFGKLVAPRQVAAYLCYRIFPHSLISLGIKFRRDHTTIIHSVKTVKKRILGDSAYCAAVLRLEQELLPYAPPIDEEEKRENRKRVGDT